MHDPRKKQDYLMGRHAFWIHFTWGFAFGGGMGAWLGSSLFDSHWAIITLAIVLALIVACCCGRWGDSAWEWMTDHLSWIFR